MKRETRAWIVVALLSVLSAAPSAGDGRYGAGPPEGRFGLGGHYAFVENRDTNEGVNMYGGMARLRSRFVGVEGSVDYRNEDLGADVDLKTWPIAASLMLFPLEPVYAIAGLGWYNATIDYPSELVAEDRTDTKLGYHVGAGVEVPVVPAFMLTGDLRYQWVDYEFDDLPDVVGEIESTYYTVHLGGLLYF